MKNEYFICGIIFLLISLTIYLTKGNAYFGYELNYLANNEKFLLHLFWSLITAYVGFGFIFVGIIKDKKLE